MKWQRFPMERWAQVTRTLYLPRRSHWSGRTLLRSRSPLRGGRLCTRPRFGASSLSACWLRYFRLLPRFRDLLGRMAVSGRWLCHIPLWEFPCVLLRYVLGNTACAHLAYRSRTGSQVSSKPNPTTVPPAQAVEVPTPGLRSVWLFLRTVGRSVIEGNPVE